jgi:hypothetical protein
MRRTLGQVPGPDRQRSGTAEIADGAKARGLRSVQLTAMAQL